MIVEEFSIHLEKYGSHIQGFFDELVLMEGVIMLLIKAILIM